MKILFIGVFDTNRKSTNTSQLLAFKNLGHNVIGYNYRRRAMLMGSLKRDLHILKTVEEGNFDLVVFSKCDSVCVELFQKVTAVTKTCLWFMDPLVSYTSDMRKKTSAVSYFCCDKKNVLEEALKLNKNSYHVCEGYDQDVDKPHDVEKEYDISFIGNIYGDRAKLFGEINHPVKIIKGAYGSAHALEVSKSRINLNFCTSEGASDRVYKVMAAGGLLVSNDWKDRSEHFTNGRDCVIFKDMNDLNEKIEFYLNNPEMADMIAKYGYETVQRFNRLNWAKTIVELSYE